MRFVGGLNRPNSHFFRYQPNIRAAMEVSQSEVSISVGGRFNFLSAPTMWVTAELEFNRQRRKINSYVGLRKRGEKEWTWFLTRSLTALCASSASVGGTEVDAPPLRTHEILPITLPGSVLVAGLGLPLLAISRVFLWRGGEGVQGLSAGFQIVGLISLIVGFAFGAVHLWGRSRSVSPH